MLWGRRRPREQGGWELTWVRPPSSKDNSKEAKMVYIQIFRSCGEAWLGKANRDGQGFLVWSCRKGESGPCGKRLFSRAAWVWHSEVLTDGPQYPLLRKKYFIIYDFSISHCYLELRILLLMKSMFLFPLDLQNKESRWMSEKQRWWRPHWAGDCWDSHWNCRLSLSEKRRHFLKSIFSTLTDAPKGIKMKEFESWEKPSNSWFILAIWMINSFPGSCFLTNSFKLEFSLIMSACCS